MFLSEAVTLQQMSAESEEPGESTSDRSRRSGDERVLDATVRAAVEHGVEFQDPHSVYVDAEALIESEVWIGAGSHILGNSRIESQARIGPNVIIEDSRIGSEAIVQPFSSVLDCSDVQSGALVKSRSELRSSVIASESEIGPNALVEDSYVAVKAKIGPFCRVRAGSEIGIDAYIGTQAEIKASRIGAGSKVGHFSFVGDAVLGNDVNVGAGSVTANFDGHQVQKTLIESEVSIGAGCVLVAPVRIGAGARTGAGAVVTSDVDSGDLVVGVPARVREMASTSI